LNRRLLEIYRDARTSLEETGANTLYLALGFLAWYEHSDSTQRRLAPIILIPLEIERHSVREGFSIARSDDEALVNSTLLELLSADFGLTIPGMDPIPQDEHGIDVRGILNAFRMAVKTIDRWEVVEAACIGLFSFTKFLMWRDLEVRSGDLARNKVVAHLINTPNQPFPTEGEFPDSGTLDDVYPPEAMFCPLSADSSQLAAVCAAAEGKSFVLHGPPGTGKSQTITNLIAHALATGKTVLFVSEKMAALDVVQRRLEQCGPGPFCLELHSNKSHKLQVLQQFGRALDEASARSSEDWLREAARLAGLRHELNAYVRALHAPRSTGESVFLGMSRLIGLRNVTSVPLGWGSEVIDREELEQLRDLSRRLELAGSESGHPTTNAWAAAQCEEWSPSWRNNVEEAVRQTQSSCANLEQSARETAPVLAMGDRWSRDYLTAMGQVASALLGSPSPPTALVTTADWESLDSAVRDWIAHGRQRDALRGSLRPRYTDQLLQLDLDALSRRLVETESAWFLPKWLGKRAVHNALVRVAQPGRRPDSERMKADLDDAIALRREDRYLVESGDRAREALGEFWRDGEADWDEISHLRDWTASLRSLAATIAGTDLKREAALRQQWANLAHEGREQLRPEGAIWHMLMAYQQRLSEFTRHKQSLVSLLSLDEESAWGGAPSPDALSIIVSRLADWMTHLSGLRAWCHWRAVRHEVMDHRLHGIVDAYETGGLPAADIPRVFDRSFYQWWVENVTDSEPVLRGFFSREFERKIRQFQDVDERYTQLTRAEIRARLAARAPQGGPAVSQNSELGILRRQMQRKIGHMPIRKLFQQIPNLLPRLKPCLLMSPMSVAQYLDPAHPPFDLVVFDEASQMPVWDAVGAIARGTEVIVVGDPMQLPPTDFFTRSDDQSIPDDSVVQDLESILDDCLAAQLQPRYLEWHYRSRHESLIAFSNYQYYNNRLLTFPSPHRQSAVSRRQVDGRYDIGKSKTNRIEAEAVVAEVLQRLRDPSLSQLSLGVVTFSLPQQTLVEDLLEDARRQNPEIEPFFTAETAPNAEPVFVKNLENVQGDERDIILFSVCYGPDVAGKVSMNFGPLNRDGGHRRLNVAITRARQEVIVFSTLRPEQIDLSRTRARGVADLKAYLEYAERGPIVLAERRTADPDAFCESPFEQQVCDALRARGYEVQPQVGCSEYRIDLAIVDPKSPGRYLLGIECDGANYHRAKTARDRDRLRESVLRGLGWQLHRVWSTDWWEKPDEELSRIEAAVDAASRQQPSPQLLARTLIAAAPTAPLVVAQPPAATAGLDVTKAKALVYTPYQVTQVLGDLNGFYDPASTAAIRARIEAVVRHEGPVSLALLLQRVAESWGIQRVAHRVRERIESIVTHAQVRCREHDGRAFLWSLALDPDQYQDFRVPGVDERSRREVEDIPPEEIAAAALAVLAAQVSLPVADLVRETARLFGFQRIGQTVEQYVRAGVKILIERGAAVDQNGMIVHQT
jgi:very-short-patch-repair endonuclease